MTLSRSTSTRALCVLGAVAVLGCGGGASTSATLKVSWSFPSGDCASNGITLVRVTWGASSGTMETVDFPCAMGTGALGELPASGGTYSLKADGLDANGVARAVNLGTTLTISKGAPPPIELTLRPKSANVVVTWSLAGAGCPSGVILPYFIGAYVPPAMTGGALGTKQTETQVTCSARTATLMNVPPGTWTIDLDSRAVQPAIKARKDVTVMPGQDATVDFQL